MSAVLSHTWSIDNTLDLTDLTAQEVDIAWRQQLQPDVRDSWYIQLDNMIEDNKTTQDGWNATLSVTTRTLTKHRQFIDAEAAQERKQLLDTEMPTTMSSFSRISESLDDNTTLADLNLQPGYVTE
jgi:hypothetical protein